MAKKAATEVNKSQAIRDFLKMNSRATNQEVSDALVKEGLDVTSNYVSTIKTNMKSKGKKKATTRKKTVAKPKAAPAKKKAVAKKKKATPAKKQTSDDKISLSELMEAKKFVAQLGGVAEAQEAIKAWKFLNG